MVQYEVLREESSRAAVFAQLDDPGDEDIGSLQHEEFFLLHPDNNGGGNLSTESMGSGGANSRALLRAKHEVSQYRNWDAIDQSVYHDERSCERFWMTYGGHFRHVEKVARRRLAAQASSATSERAFSKAGHILTKRRLALSPQSVDDLSFLAWRV